MKMVQAHRQTLLDGSPSFLISPRFLRARLLVYAFARFAVVAAIIAGAWFAAYVVGIEELPILGLHVLAACLFLFNLGVFSLLYWGLLGVDVSHWRLMLIMHVTINLDFVFLTAALWLVGGAASPFASFYILHIILAAMLLPREAVFYHALFGYLLFAGLVLSQLFELAPVFMPAGAIVSDVPISGRYALTVLTVQAILFTVTTLLVSEIATALKKGERALSALNEELVHLSEMRRDFLHIVVHNLKAPAAAATMLLEVVETLWQHDTPENVRTAVARARIRTQDLSNLVHDIQNLAVLESGALRNEEQSVNLNDIARDLAQAYEEPAAQKGQRMEVTLEPSLPDIHAVPRLIREAAVNYVTNAMKYTPEGGRITLRTRSENDEVIFEVLDTGVGIAPEYLSRLFGEFVRAPSYVSGQRPTGVGLGLSIVKRIVEYYNGRVYVNSEVDKGSVFGFALPAVLWTPNI